MNKEKIPNELSFKCRIEYSTEAEQRVTYYYNVQISNDTRIEVVNDEVEKIEDCKNNELKTSTVFRNLQDYITVDRAAYIWEKMGQSQARGFFTLVGPWSMQQGNDLTEVGERKEPRV